MYNDKNFTENDWKLFKSKIGQWQELHIDRLNNKYIQLLSDKDKVSSEKFWELHKRIQKDKYNTGVQIEVRRSNLIPSIMELINDGIIHEKELEEFSPELREKIDYLRKRF
ncbi:MAG: multidrug transporter [Clostridia bacterium]